MSKNHTFSLKGSQFSCLFKSFDGTNLDWAWLEKGRRNRCDVFRLSAVYQRESPVNKEVGSARSGWRRTCGPLCHSAASKTFSGKENATAVRIGAEVAGNQL